MLKCTANVSARQGLVSLNSPVCMSSAQGQFRSGCCRKKGQKHNRHQHGQIMLSLYYPNSLTFIANLTGADSVSHKINGQKHSDKQLQENNPLGISSHIDLVLEAICWQQYFSKFSVGLCGNTVMGTSHSCPSSLVCSAAASHGLLTVSKIPQQFPFFLFEQTKPNVTVLQVTL